MKYTEKQQVERSCFNDIVHQKWDGKSLVVDAESPPFADYNGDLFDGARLYLKDFSNKKILEIGCGSGELSVWFAKNAAEVYGVDISDESIAIAETRSQKNGTQDKTHFFACAAEQLPFEDSFFDIVFINVSLHHLEIDIALEECRRVLKAGGDFLAIEPLAFSKRIQNIRTSKVFSSLYPIRRETPTERILSLDDIQSVKTVFTDVQWVPYRMCSPFVYKIQPLFSFMSRLFFRKEENSEVQKRKMNRLLQRYDERLLSMFPILKVLSRYVVIYAKK